ncbi:hypothetical protein Cni_G05705 [Canna indica]|uniref:Trichome birefringence-like N-terminal domain-containing protein n=1 Tax=Canna indica TaxID=4628 RepID=A0AAQ3Q5N2_9LILI|nr:hypothetical protein Cni_G05705 [Canna indica]
MNFKFESTRKNLNRLMQRKKVAHSRDDEQGQECEMAANNQFTLKLWSLRYRFNSTVTVFIAFVIVLAIFITIKNGEQAEILAIVGVDEACDLFSDQWVYDNTTYPLYSERGCRFMSEQIVSVELEPDINAKGGKMLSVDDGKEAMKVEEEEEKLTSAVARELWEQKRKMRRS